MVSVLNQEPLLAIPVVVTNVTLVLNNVTAVLMSPKQVFALYHQPTHLLLVLLNTVVLLNA